MPNIQFTGIDTKLARHLQSGGADAYGNSPERVINDDGTNPCRHCLDFIAEGEEMLIVALRPFDSIQPYAETGPAFLHAGQCAAYRNGAERPPVLYGSRTYITRAYDREERIIYGTGGVTEANAIHDRARSLLQRQEVAFVDVRSSSNNCWQARMARTSEAEPDLADPE